MADKRSGGGGAFLFIRGRGSIRKELKQRHNSSGEESSSGLTKWFRDLRPTATLKSSAPPLDRAHPVYHSEGKGLRRRKDRDRRRHSFNEQQPENQAANSVDANGCAAPTPAAAAPTTTPAAPAPSHMARDAAAASPGRVMMSSRSTPNLQACPSKASIYSYLHTQSGLNFAPVVQAQTDAAPPPPPPVRDASSLKGVKYGPGHEKFPSWPVSAAADTPQAVRGPPGGGSHRSKSWTDHTNYPKEKGITYTRPYMKRPNPAFTQQQLKTVMERCEKIPLEAFESRAELLEDGQARLYLPKVDREGKALGDTDYMVPSPPERDISSKPQLTQADLEEYARSYQDHVDLEAYARSYQDPKPQASHLTQADLEEYSRTYEEALKPQHQQQQSYAQSEGYHSYVSSTDSITTTPFLDRLRRDSEVAARPAQTWDEHPAGRDSVVTTSSGSASSSETLKWHGSLSDVSVASSACTHQQLIAHSARVQTPQRHHSESVLYLEARVQRNNQHNKLRLFPVNTYTVQPGDQQQPATHSRLMPMSPPPPALSVAERISEIERQQTRYTYLDPDKRHRVSDPTLKAIQKKALLSFYERHHAGSARSQAWRSEPQLAQPASAPPCPQSPPPYPPPRPRAVHSARRASSASDYAGGAWREMTTNKENINSDAGSIRDGPHHQHSSSCGSLSADLLGPLIVGPSISVDDWVPERPPKKPHLRSAFPPPVPERFPSPDLPPPSPPTVLEDEVFASDEPLPPPPPELNPTDWPVITPPDNPQLHGERGSRQSSPGNPAAHRHLDAFQRHQANSSNRSPDPSNSLHNDSTLQKHAEGPSPQRSTVQNYSENTSSSQSASDANMSRVAVANSMKKSSDSTQKTLDSSAASQQKCQKNNSLAPSSPKGNQKQVESAIPFQRYLERGFSLPRNIEDSAALQNSLSMPDIVIQKHRESATIHKQIVSSTPVQRYTSNGLSQRQLENGSSSQKQLENGNQRLSENVSLPLATVDTNISVSRHINSVALSKKQESSTCRNMNDTFSRTSAIRPLDTDASASSGIPLSRQSDGSRSSLRYPTQKLLVNGKVAMPVTEQGKLRDSQPDLVKTTSLRTGEAILPSKMRLQSLSPAGSGGEGSTSDEASSSSRSSPHLKAENDAVAKQQQVEDCSSKYRGHGSKASVTPPSDGSNGGPQCQAKVESTNQEQAVLSNGIPVQNQQPAAKASYVAYRRDKDRGGLSCSEGSYKRVSTPPNDSGSGSETTVAECDKATSIEEQEEEEQQPTSHPVEAVTEAVQPKVQVTESLQLVQRSEVVLRVNAATSDAASQTESEREVVDKKPELVVQPFVRQKLQEEIECERLSLDLVSHLPPSDKLQGLLVPAAEHKKPTDYVSGLFKLDVTPRPRVTPLITATSQESTVPRITTTTTTATSGSNIPTLKVNERGSSEEVSNSSSNRLPSESTVSPLSASSAYFTTSESKAKFLTRYGRDMNQSEHLNGLRDNKELQQKKEELMSRLDRKLQVLRGEHLVVTEESRVNDELGESVAAQVSRLARPHEASKYRLHVEEVGKITSLLLGLSGRLARAENALMGLPHHHAERKILESKRDKLKEQLEEAKKLKENIDRRSVCVSNILYKYFSAEEYADYDHFINMKAKLIMDSREIADKIKLGEEQLAALKETLSAPD
ncbi:protein Shroom isoform X2 [Periplaneta americana]|uniref:protein Shroom isoform X2 n=1 Tax=Periplaneta americana TaxID=6978 RepID=UPI0037E887C0